MENKILRVKEWLGAGSINIFGLPMSGKDTQGEKLAEALGAKLLSSGMIIREMEAETNNDFSGNGKLIPSNVFYQWVLPYLERRELFGRPLVLSSIGRWIGEENQVMNVAAGAGHEIKAVIYLELPDAEVKRRFNASKELNDRGSRADDGSLEIFETRLKEFYDKTAPVIRHYNELGLLIRVNGAQARDEVFAEIVEKLYQKIA